jgi:NADPH:quinone reductase-like Zn-dependent oxidoreductase
MLKDFWRNGMKAAIVLAAGKAPVYGDFETPAAKAGEVLVAVRAAALSHLTKGRASGAHYSSAGIFPAIAGTDGVGVTGDGRRVYFAMPDAPFGSMAEFCPVSERRLVEVPEGLDDVTAAAIANPGMSAWAALVERAQLKAGETVLVNGATGTAGRVAVQLARYLGAGKVIVTGRNAAELGELGADVAIAFALDTAHPEGATAFEEALTPVFAAGIDVAIDYLWGKSAETLIAALARTVGEKRVRFVQVGSAGGEGTIALPGAALRSAAIELMGSGIGSVGRAALLHGIRSVFEAVGPAGLAVETRVVPLAEVEGVWDAAGGRPRVVFTLG